MNEIARDDVDGRDVEVLAVADHVVEAAVLDHLDAVLDGALLAHEVDDRLGAAPVGQLLHGVDVAAVDLHRVVGADLAGQRQRLLARVDHDDLGRRYARRHWIPMWPSPPAPITTARVPRRGSGSPLTAWIAEAGVGQSGDLGRVQRGVELDHERAGVEEVGEAAVAVDAGERAVLAVHVVAAAAGAAQPARDVRVHDHRVADLDVGHARADLVDPARVRDRACRAASRRTSRPTGPPGCGGRCGTGRRPIFTTTSSGPTAFGSSTSSSFSARGTREGGLPSCRHLLSVASLQQIAAHAAVRLERHRGQARQPPEPGDLAGRDRGAVALDERRGVVARVHPERAPQRPARSASGPRAGREVARPGRRPSR